jgi:hypothetical protein
MLRPVLLLLLFMGIAQATIIEYDIDAVFWGYCTNNPAACSSGGGYLVEYDQSKRNIDYFWFDIPVLPGPVMSVALQLDSGLVTGDSLAYTVRNSTLLKAQLSYANLYAQRTQTTYGTRTYSDALDDGTTRDVLLNADALAAINAMAPTGGAFHMAGFLSVVSSQNRKIFEGTGALNTRRLILQVDAPDNVPEPATLFLLGSALTALGFAVQRRKRAR